MPSLLQDFFYVPHLLETKHGVELTWSPVIPNFVVKIWLGAKPPMVTERSSSLVELVIVRGNHSAFAGRENLSREKRKRSGSPE